MQATGIGIILLAAGRGRRMERPKLTLPWGPESTVVGAALRSALAAPVSAVVAVTGAQDEAVRAALAAAATAPCPDRGPAFRTVHNPEWDQGMSTSLKAGLQALPSGLAGFFVALGDMPLILPSVYVALISAFGRQEGIWLPTYQGRRGHPVLLPIRFAAEAAHLEGDVGMRGVLKSHAGEVRELATAEEGVVIDLDTPEEYQRFRPPMDRATGM